MKKIKISNTIITTCTEEEMKEVFEKKGYPDFCKKRGNHITVKYGVYGGYNTEYYFNRLTCNRELITILVANLISENFPSSNDFSDIYFKAQDLISSELDPLDKL